MLGLTAHQTIAAAETERNVRISVVAPCYNEEQVLPIFLARVHAVCRGLGVAYEIVVVDDGSSDATWSLIEQGSALDSRVLGLKLRRNHGHQIALSAGIAASSGGLLLLIDADLQDPPELLPVMLELMRERTADVVYGQRRLRAGEAWFKRASASGFYRMINWLSDVDIPKDTGDFRLITRDVADLLCRMPEQHRFIRGMVAWIGGVQVPLAYDREAREAGVSKYPFRKMLRFANDAVTSFSRRPLQVATNAGLICALGSALLAILSVVRWWAGMTVPGWTSLMTVLGFFSAMQFFMMGIMGEYVGRMYEQSRQRPLYMEARRCGTGLGRVQPAGLARQMEETDIG